MLVVKLVVLYRLLLGKYAGTELISLEGSTDGTSDRKFDRMVQC